MVRGFGEQGAIRVGEKIKVAKPLVILHGDEMAQIAFERILEQFVTGRLDIDLVEIDLTAENRLVTNGEAVRDAIAHGADPDRPTSQQLGRKTGSQSMNAGLIGVSEETCE